MGLRRAASYSKMSAVPFTRISRKKNKSFIKVVQPQKIVKFSMGNESAFSQGKFPFQMSILANEKCQIRHNSLEACRQFVNRKMEDAYAGQYFFRVIPYPHHIQRENKMLTGAGADRMSTGMQLSFGKSSGKAAIVNKDGHIFFMAVPTEKILSAARKFFKQVQPKLPCTTHSVTEVVKE